LVVLLVANSSQFPAAANAWPLHRQRRAGARIRMIVKLRIGPAGAGRGWPASGMMTQRAREISQKKPAGIAAPGFLFTGSSGFTVGVVGADACKLEQASSPLVGED